MAVDFAACPICGAVVKITIPGRDRALLDNEQLHAQWHADFGKRVIAELLDAKRRGHV